MKESVYVCDFCLLPIVDTTYMYSYRGEEYGWLFDYDNGFELHQDCIPLWSAAKLKATEAAKQVFKDARSAYTTIDSE